MPFRRASAERRSGVEADHERLSAARRLQFAAGMIVIHGVDRYGKVDAVDGEYLVTRFHQLFAFPVIPIGSEWITGRDRLGLYGRACRLSLRSVMAAYLRTWGLAIAGLLTALALRGAVELVGPAVMLVILAAATLPMRQIRDPRELRRIALQRPVLGIALDPLRLPRDTAALLLALAQQRFEALSGGRTALDVVYCGATSAAEAGHAFVLLRLLAVAHQAKSASDALAASERLLDGTRVAQVSDSPYRASAIPVASMAAPLLESYLLRPRRWYGVIATLVLWAACVAHLPREARCCMCGEGTSDIGRAGVKKLAFESFPQWHARHRDGRCPSVTELTEYGGSVKDPWGSPYQLRCDDLPDGAVGIAVWSIGEDQRDSGGNGDDIASWK